MEKKIMNPRNKDDYKDEVLSLRRVTKVTKGGRTLHFSAFVAVGDGKGRVGIGSGKSSEVVEAIKKARMQAVKNVKKIEIVDGRTISHDMIGIQGAAKVLLKPAKAGTGIIAGGPVRVVLELAGFKDVVSKSLGSNTKINTSKATMNALTAQKSAKHIAKLRGKSVEEILG
jgi:small subunit ribosomal protein S5